MTVNLEVICIGNELLIGKIKDTNAHYIATHATQLGANVKRVTVIQDIIEEIATTIQEALARKPHFLITTGGLGPTFDDKTFEAVAKAFNQKLVVNQEALALVKQRYIEYAKKRQLTTEFELTPPRLKMATLPENAYPVNNPVGSAPAIRVNYEGTILFVLPGVPQEAEAIFESVIAPLISQGVGNSIFCERSLFVFMAESRLAPLIDRVMADNSGVYIKSHPLPSESKPRVELHLTITDTQDQQPAEKLVKASQEIAKLILENGGELQGQV
ncbi:MAG: molybdopterin-binding protein [Candidatus Bathyarchaeota archaeon]|nr:molybdopterin-binding protein [Candidatus Bathyarchaeota archaeon]